MRADRKFVPLAVTGVLAIALVGCTSGGKVAPSPSGSTSVSGSPSPSSSESSTASPSPSASVSVEVPEAARANTPEGATEFAKWYLMQGAQANVDWDTTALRAYALPECITCNGVIKGVEELKAKGEHEREARYRFIASQIGPGDEPQTMLVDVLGEYLAGDVVNSSGSVVATVPAERSDLRVTTTWRDGWRVREVAVIKR